jgi:hypothetical protein
MIAIFGYPRFALFNEVRRAAAAGERPAAALALGRIRVGARQPRARGIIIVVTRLGAVG